MSLSDNVAAVLLPKQELFAMPTANVAKGNARCAPAPVLTLLTSPDPRRALAALFIHRLVPIIHLSACTSPNSHMTLQVSLSQRGTLSLPCLNRNHALPRLLQLPQ